MARRSLGLGLVVALMAADPALVATQSPGPPAVRSPAIESPVARSPTGQAADGGRAAARALLDTYCVGCHNERSQTAGLMFDRLDLVDLDPHTETWEQTVRKLRGGMMPPPGMRRPDPATVDAMVAWLEGALDALATAEPDPGRVPLHRLNRTEYGRAIKDLLDLDIDPTALLPQDDQADGFDNVASALTVSPAFLDQYISAARVVTRRALGDPAPRPDSATYRPAAGTDQRHHVEGLPLGTRGGLLVEHLFPADGEYRLTIRGLAGAGYVRGTEYRHRVVVTVDGVRVFEDALGGETDLRAIDQEQASAVAAINGRFADMPVSVTAGPHRIGVTFVARSFAESDEVLHAQRPVGGEERVPTVNTLEVVGPFAPTGVSDTPSRQRLFVCRPAAPDEARSCATEILGTLARRAYRRPLNDADLVAPLAFYDAAQATGGFEAGIRNGMMAILASPKFLFRAEPVPEGLPPGSVYPLSDLELASRLAFFLTGSPPDDQLLEAAAGNFETPEGLDAQVDRLLADPRSRSLVSSFAFQWLKMRTLEDIEPDPVIFPSFDESLRQAFGQELALFLDSILREDRSVLELLISDRTFVNERLALHYGIPGVRGSRFRPVTLDDPNRFGLLGKGSVLLATSYANRTAPVIRGAWILENLLGTPPVPPPPDVEAFPENQEGEPARSVREIMEQHRANPACSSCHRVMDPLGFALENFDAIGTWRTKDRDAGTPIDASGTLVDGTEVHGPIDLRAALLARPEQFVQTLTEKLMTYALGRTVDYRDMPAIRRIVHEAAAEDYRFSALVRGIVRSVPFRMRKLPEE